MRFPDGFLWGVSTSAYQVEGAVDADGRGRSIWDTFSHREGTIEGGGTGDVACDHYRRWETDLDLVASLGANAYRFSLAWPRIVPDGRGRVEQRGLDHYDRLIDGLLARGIEPVVTLYHWDLPQPLEDKGGWQNRETAHRFAEYAQACADAFGDRVSWWITVNEPWIVGLLGYRLGLHAPGHSSPREEVVAFHHLLLAHGLASDALGGRAGVAFALSPHYPYSESAEDEAATHESDGYVNRFFLDAVLKGAYPRDTLALFERTAGPLDFVVDGDEAIIGRRQDFVGVNYYARRVMRAVPEREPYPWEVVVDEGVPMTEARTEITPSAFTDLLLRLHRDYPGVPLLVTENGAVFNDEPGADGRVHDERRVAFLRAHLQAVHAAIAQGAPVAGYCHWSLMDNFEWALGYGQRFGLVHVDYETLARTVKDSGREFVRIAKANAL
jgi:beta-glucosidase